MGGEDAGRRDALAFQITRAVVQPGLQAGGPGVEEDAGHVAAVGDLHTDGARPVRDAGEDGELGVCEAALTEPGAGGGDPSQEGAVAVGHRPAQHPAQVLVGVEVGGIVGGG
ncbi:hypothetical protein DMH12_37730, partial [Streptomyces sp. WAC 04229]